MKVPNPDHVVVTNGGMHGLYIIFRALVEPGDEVILPDPMWTEIAENIRLSGGLPVPVRLRADNGYQYDPSEIEAAITPRTRAIFVNTPHNPVGVVAGRAVLEGIASVAERHDLMLISDEAYEHVIFDGQRHVSLGSLPPATSDSRFRVPQARLRRQQACCQPPCRRPAPTRRNTRLNKLGD